MSTGRYVLVTACRNESAYVEKLIDSIAAQTLRPMKWIIVDDGSTDDTFARATRHSAGLDFVEIVKMPGGKPRSFSSQVYAAMHGCSVVQGLQYDFIGLLDADILVEPHYYARLVELTNANPKIGISGGAVIDVTAGGTDNPRGGSEDYHVAGGVQFIRRECFAAIGGHHPISGGGQDTIADIMAMMHGWEVRVFPELVALHLRPDGFSKENVLKRGKHWGRKFYLLGYHPLYYLGQCVRRLGRKPMIVGSACMLYGYLVANFKAEPRPVSPEFVRFIRQLQMKRLARQLGLAKKSAT